MGNEMLPARPRHRHHRQGIPAEDRDRLNGQVTRILQKAAYSQQEPFSEIRSLIPAPIT